MEHIGAGLAALGVFGPGIGIGILAGMSAQAIGRNPDAAGQIRGIAIILAAFAEGLGVLAIVVGLLAIFIKEPTGTEKRPWIFWPSRQPSGRGSPVRA
jgi:F-type H+-transporting ATPase subunit c